LVPKFESIVFGAVLVCASSNKADWAKEAAGNASRIMRE
jgi:hypothetical protein